ncbi:DUF3105 domain-containing protein [Schumannella sp. 10F1B-5-1]|uniref:DUF3105 domain-containing protein n=1 Tax=Schumannella sp. 10F1B-5-1 TaxID=2590780 RepID=UPI00113250D4|nr:DUF3105 domain-containing protein [Schumannella sp. 10F1B-5-1]TPW73436.1 DUF3105 domain-containing protein [Schumannella sp. 10F1B-5-1]
MPRDESAPRSNAGAPATTKQQRAAQREAKVAAFKKKEVARRRNRRLAIGGGITAGVAAIVAITLAIVLPLSAGGGNAAAPAKLNEVQTWSGLSSTHTNKTVDYRMSPPAGGPHNATWLNCGVYDQPVPNENAVHDLEHGAIWFTYDPDRVSGVKLDALKAIMPDSYATLSPYPGLNAPMAASAWGAQIKFSNPENAKVAQFIEDYWRSPNAPEPGAPCTGGLDAPGKVG